MGRIMKRRILLITVVFILSTACLISSDNFFIVLSSINTTEYKDSDGWKNIHAGDTLPEKSIVKIGEDSYLSLVYSTGNTLEINKKGVYPLENYLQKLLSPKAPIIVEIVDYLIKEIGMSKDIIKTKELSTGEQKLSVERTVKFKIGETPRQIKLRLPYKTDIIGSEIELSWNSADVSEYEVHISLLFKDIFTKVVTDNTFMLKRREAGLKDNEYYFCYVASKENPEIKSEEVCIRFLSEEDEDKIKEQLDNLTVNIDETSALGKIIIASFYERNNLIMDADKLYREAIAIEPASAEYYYLYLKFQKRNGIRDI